MGPGDEHRRRRHCCADVAADVDVAPLDELRAESAAIDRHALCRGPGNLTMAMGITLTENGLDLVGDRLYVEDRRIRRGSIAWGPRIGTFPAGDAVRR